MLTVPLVAPETAVMVSTWPSVDVSMSLSLDSSCAWVNVNPTSSFVLLDSPIVTGASLTAAKLMLATAVAYPPLPSLTV